MYGKIIFDNAASLAEFLKEFTGSSAVFDVHQEGSAFVLKFNGGY